MDLLANRLIDDPFHQLNTTKTDWIETATVTYRTNFSVDAPSEGLVNRELIFYGIDSEADVFLNDEKILSAENAFMQYIVGISSKVQKTNTITVQFSQAKSESMVNNSVKLMYDFTHHRKSASQYGGTLTPRLVTLGLWKKVEVVSTYSARFDYIWVRTRSISSQLSQEDQANHTNAVLSVAIVIKGNLTSVAANLELIIRVNGVEELERIRFYNDHVKFHNLTIPQAKLWWPRGAGEPYQYELEFELRAFDFKI